MTNCVVWFWFVVLVQDSGSDAVSGLQLEGKHTTNSVERTVNLTSRLHCTDPLCLSSVVDQPRALRKLYDSLMSGLRRIKDDFIV